MLEIVKVQLSIPDRSVCMIYNETETKVTQLETPKWLLEKMEYKAFFRASWRGTDLVLLNKVKDRDW